MYFKLLYRYNYSHNRKTLFKYVSEILHIAFEIDFKLLYRCTEGKTENHNRKRFFKFRFSTKAKTSTILAVAGPYYGTTSHYKKVEFDQFQKIYIFSFAIKL